MKKILLPTDFSDNALNAMLCSLKMYKDIPCRFYILNAYTASTLDLISRLLPTKAQYERMEEASEKGLQALLERLKKEKPNPKHRFFTVSKLGAVTVAIRETILQKGIDLIIMGTQGATGAKEIFMGSNTVKVIKSFHTRPIIAIPNKFRFNGLKKLIFATDFNRPFLKQELHELIELAKIWQSNMRVFHLSHDLPLSKEQVVNKEVLKQYLKGLDYTFSKGILHETILESIEVFVEKRKVDMIVLINYKKSFLENMIEMPVVKKVSFRTKVPFLVLPELNITN